MSTRRRLTIRAGERRVTPAIRRTLETIQTERESVSRALHSFAIAAVRHGPVDRVTWTVDGRSLALAPITEAAAPVVLGDELKDLGSIIGRMAIEELGGSVALDGDALRVQL